MMGTIGILLTWRTMAIPVVIVLTLAQTLSVLSARCGDTNRDVCCYDLNGCPSGYYKDSNCLSSSVPSTTTTMTQKPTLLPSTTNNAGNSSRSTAAGTNTSISISQTTTPGSSPTSSTTLTVSPTRETVADDTGSSVSSAKPTTTTAGQVEFVCRQCYEECDSMCPTTGVCRTVESTKFPVVAVAAGVVGGVVFLVGIVVVACCIKRHRRQRRPGSPGCAMDGVINEREECKSNNDDDDSVEAPKFVEPEYANMACRPGNLSENIQQGQDKIFRYVKDPTDHVTKRTDDPLYENQMVVHMKKQEEEHEEIAALGEAPVPPPSTQGASSRQKTDAKKPTTIGMDDADTEEIYYNTDGGIAALQGGEHPEGIQSFNHRKSIDNAAKNADDEDTEEIYYNDEAKIATLRAGDLSEEGADNVEADDEQVYCNEGADVGCARDGGRERGLQNTDTTDSNGIYVNYGFHKASE